MEGQKKVAHRRGHSSDLGKPGQSPREKTTLDLSKLFEKLQEMKHADKNSTSLKKLQDTLAYFIDQEKILRNKVEKEGNTSPEKNLDAKPKKKSTMLSASQPHFQRSSSSPQHPRRPSYELILHELTSEIVSLKEFLTKRRTNKPLQKVASANKMLNESGLSAEESSFTGAENSFLSEADTDTLEDFSDDDDHYESAVALFDWNNLFQSIYEQDESFSRESEWASISQDFIHNSLTYGKIIISEAFIPNKNKTLQPLPNQESTANYPLQCYVHKGIFYKLMMDPCKPYANLNQAMTFASNEMRTWKELLLCKAPGLCLPFMVQIDSQGFRLLAISEMPVGLHTIVYGSNDGGKTVHNDNVEFEKKMEEVAKQLNLKRHSVGGRQLYTSALTEGHLGLDGRFYVTGSGMAHLFPTEPSTASATPSNVTHFLRPEFIKTYVHPLSSDAFSKFSSEAPECEEEITAACSYLQNVTVPQFAQWLDSKSETLKSNLEIDLVTALHKHGLSIRHLGYVRSCCKSPVVKEVLLTEIIARVIKNRLRATLRQKTREVPPMLLTPVQYAVVDFLNMIFGKTLTSKIFWATELVELVTKFFPGTLTRECAAELRNLGLALGGDPKMNEMDKDKEGLKVKEKEAKRKGKGKQKVKDKFKINRNKDKFAREKEREREKEKDKDKEKEKDKDKEKKKQEKEKDKEKDKNKGIEKVKDKDKPKDKTEKNKDKDKDKDKPAKDKLGGKGASKDRLAKPSKNKGVPTSRSSPTLGVATVPEAGEEEAGGEEIFEPREEVESTSDDTTEDSRTEDTDTRTEEVEMSDHEDMEKELFLWALGQGREVDTASLFARVLAVSGVLLTVKAQQQFFDNPRTGLWLTYQDIVGLQTRVKYLNEKGQMVKAWM